MKKAKINVLFMAQVQHGFNKIISNGGRAEQSTKMFGIDFVDAYGQQDCFESFLVDVPSQ